MPSQRQRNLGAGVPGETSGLQLNVEPRAEKHQKQRQVRLSHLRRHGREHLRRQERELRKSLKRKRRRRKEKVEEEAVDIRSTTKPVKILLGLATGGSQTLCVLHGTWTQDSSGALRRCDVGHADRRVCWGGPLTRGQRGRGRRASRKFAAKSERGPEETEKGLDTCPMGRLPSLPMAEMVPTPRWVAVLVLETVSQATGMWVKVQFLGATTEEEKKQASKFFRGSKSQVHICFPGEGKCAATDEPGLHLRRFQWYPPQESSIQGI